MTKEKNEQLEKELKLSKETQVGFDWAFIRALRLAESTVGYDSYA